MTLVSAAESGWLPDWLIRIGIRNLVRQRLRDERNANHAERLAELERSPLALNTVDANEQHYEVPTAFFKAVLGPRLKYSASLFEAGIDNLADAESFTLNLYRARADIQPGHRVLDLGCGWGSFSLWLAEREPGVQITAVSNSATQRDYIESCAARRGLTNLRVITCDINQLDLPAESFDRVVSVEMFEHVRNYRQLLNNIARWLVPGGCMLVHIFCHSELVYPFETEGDSNWMGRYFFTGGLMPSARTLPGFQDDLHIVREWFHNGQHYQRTARAWLDNLDARTNSVRASLERTYGRDQVDVWVQRWRMFFMACEEMFAYDGGRQWQIGHYLFEKPVPESVPEPDPESVPESQTN